MRILFIGVSFEMIEASVFLLGEEVTPTFYRNELKPFRVDWDADQIVAHVKLFELNSCFTYPQIGPFSESTRS
mgnify:CR=1 FL=1